MALRSIEVPTQEYEVGYENGVRRLIPKSG